ncbi:MAG: branched-chain amino acid transaminase [Clostridia bacterium]|nr:branched-chain amino acid transaminase [Deltaproteobacteria bacterium]
MQKSDWIWRNGELIRWDDANVHVTTHSLHYGLAAFEGIRCYQTKDGGGAIFRLKEHMVRLHESCQIALMPLSVTVDQLVTATVDLVRKNRMQDGCYIRPLSYISDGPLGIAAENATHTQIIAWRWGSYLGDDGIKNGIRCKISSFRRPQIDAVMAKGKISGNYVNSILARREVGADGYQEALLLDAQGYVVEGSGENLFIVKNGRVRTPPRGAAILLGITRDTVLQLLAEANVQVDEAVISRDELYTADEVFLTGTAAEVTPAREIDNRKVGTGKPGEITRLVQEAYAKAVSGQLPSHESWLTRV